MTAPLLGRCPTCGRFEVWLLPWLDRGVTRWTCGDCPTPKDET